MNKLIMILIILCPVFLLGQKSIILSEIQQASASYQSVSKHISNALSSIDQCYDATSASQVRSSLNLVKVSVNNAHNAVSNAIVAIEETASISYDLSCIDGAEHTMLCSEKFMATKSELAEAIDRLTVSSTKKNRAGLETQLEKSIEHLYEALKQIKGAVEQLNYIIGELEECDLSDFSRLQPNQPALLEEDPAFQAQFVDQKISCEVLLNAVTKKGRKKGLVSSLQLYNAPWLQEVKAFSLEQKIVVIAKIKRKEWSLDVEEYVFYGIPENTWNDFYYGQKDAGLSYGERFQKYLLEYSCFVNVQ